MHSQMNQELGVAMAKVNVSVAIEESTLKELDELAEKMGLSRSAVIGMQLKAFNEGDIGEMMAIFSQMAKVLAENKKARKKAEKALKDKPATA